MALMNVFYLTENVASKTEGRICFDTQSRDQVTYAANSATAVRSASVSYVEICFIVFSCWTVV